MSTPLVGRRCGNRRVLWRRVCVRGLDAALVVLVVFLIITCVVGASSEAPFFTTWWGTHLFILLLFFFTMAVLVAAVLPMLRWLRLPLDQLPDLDADSSGDESINRSGQRVSRRGLVALAVIIGVPVLVGLFYLEENQRGERAWNRYKQEQEDRGERLDPAVLVPPPVPDDQNFAATPFLAPLFDFLPGTQQPRDPIAAGRTKTLSPRYDRVSSEVRPRKVARSNSWVSAEIDLSAWHAALPESTNASPAQEVAARWRVMKSYGIMPVRAGVATTH
ncbi:MAG: hypothetical protein NT154_31360, partial [Verrucomicrobia bacterium]|nr:hypothetical protein [Verrucomicrobiota bacterium]